MTPGSWSWSPEALLGVGLGAAYLYAVRRYTTAAWRIACGLCACALLVAVWITPIDTIALHYLLLFHLLQNVVLAEWAPLLLVLGTPPGLAVVLTRVTAVRWLTHPLVALPLWIGNYALWHTPAIYDAALRRPASLLVVEHLCYLVTGVAMWWCVWQDAPHRLSSAKRAVYVFAAFVFSAPLGLVLALVSSPIYDFYADAPERLFGISRLVDQQLGGLTMASEQALVFFAAFAFWFLRFLEEEEREDLAPATADPPQARL